MPEIRHLRHPEKGVAAGCTQQKMHDPDGIIHIRDSFRRTIAG
jgi:hypothetical protein